MFEFEIGIDPNLLEIGPYVLAWHGILTVIAILAGAWIARIGLRERKLNLPKLEPFTSWTIAGGIAGARLFYVFDHLDRFRDDPLEIFALSKGGLAVYGRRHRRLRKSRDTLCRLPLSVPEDHRFDRTRPCDGPGDRQDRLRDQRRCLGITNRLAIRLHLHPSRRAPA